MTAPAEIYALSGAIVACWIILIIRLVTTWQRHRHGHHVVDNAHVVRWSIWAIVGSVILAGTTNHPLVIQFFEEVVGQWFGTIPRTVFAALAYVIGGRVCLEFLPTHKQFRWDWSLVAGLLTIGAYTLLMVLVVSFPDVFPNTIWFYRKTIADPLLYAYILVSTVHIILPALNWLRHTEENAVMRFRLLSLIGTYALVVLWMVNDIALQFMTELGLPYEFHNVIHPVVNAGVGPLFMLSFFAPSEFYIWLAKPINYVASLITYICLRRVEGMACRWTNQSLSSHRGLDVLQSPSRAIYVSAINILDARKMLKVHPDLAARNLGARLDLAARSDLELSDVVTRLRRVGRDYLVRNSVNATAT